MNKKVKCNHNCGRGTISWCNFMPYIVIIILALMVLSSCSSVQRKDDAVRIKKDKDRNYNILQIDEENQTKRDGSTLRGTVLRIIKETRPNSCPVMDTTTYSNKFFVEFLDKKAGDNNLELIPLEDVELIGQKEALRSKLSNRYNNINWFENFNDPLDPRSLREVPVDSFYISNCPGEIDCNCNPLSLALKCPDCDYASYFVELRAAYAVYDDININNQSLGRDSYYGEAAFGYRWNSWGLGLMVSTGVPVFNSKIGTDIWRPIAMLHGRKQFDKFLCMYPFVYAQLGFALDVETTRLFSNCDCDCGIQLPSANISLPLSYGFGAGLDIPLPFCMFDVSLDMGYKSVLIGETFNTLLFNNVSDSRRIHMFVLRLGITLGY